MGKSDRAPRWLQLVGPAIAFGTVAGVLAGVSCSLATSPSDYTGTEAQTTAGVGGDTGGDGGTDVELPETTVARVFLLGGDRDAIDDFAISVTDVWVAEILEDGSTTAWRDTTATYYGGRFGVSIIDDQLFAMGRSPSVDSSDRFIVMAAPLTDSGLGEWTGATDENKNYDVRLVTVLYGNYAYAIGGSYTYTDDAGSHTGWEDDVMKSRLEEMAATVEPWEVAERLDTGRRAVGALVHQEHLFVIGGDRWGEQGDVEAAKVDPVDGTLEPFLQLSTLGDVLGDGGVEEYGTITPAVCDYGEDIYVIGGDQGVGPAEPVWRATFDATLQELSAWEEVTRLPRGLDGPGCLAINGRLYLFGGSGPSARSDLVLVASIAEDGTLGSWEEVAEPLPFGRSHMSVAHVSP